MRHAATRSLLAIILPGLLALACGKKEEEPPPQYGQQPYGQQPGYQQQPYGQQPGYQQPAPAATPAPAPTAAPAPAPTAAPAPAPAAGTTGAMSQPAPMALPCQQDSQCFTHRCNTAAGKCAWPCQSDADCQPGNQCVAPQCLPKAQ